MHCYTSNNFNRYFFKYQKSKDGIITITSIYNRNQNTINPTSSLLLEIFEHIKSLTKVEI